MNLRRFLTVFFYCVCGALFAVAGMVLAFRTVRTAVPAATHMVLEARAGGTVVPLGTCRKSVTVPARATILMACLFDLPTTPRSGDFVQANVKPGLAGFRTRLYGAVFQPPARAVVYFFIENSGSDEAETLAAATAVLYRAPDVIDRQMKTPAVAAAGVE